MSKISYQDLLLETQSITADIDKHGYMLMFLALLSVVTIILCVGILLRQNTMMAQNRESFGSLRGKIDLQNQSMAHDTRIIEEIKNAIDRNTAAINSLLAYLERHK